MKTSLDTLATRLGAILMLAIFCLTTLRADEETASLPKPVEKERQDRMLKFAQSHKVIIAGSNEEAMLLNLPIFSWANPQRSAIGGALYMWTLKGRPVATIGLWTYKDTKDSYEYQSLHEGALDVTCDAGEDWRPKDPGLKYLPIPNAETPAESKTLRLIQMRKIARDRFSSHAADGSDQRLLPTPIYRYDEFPDNVFDGAVFSFADGTDPETLLVFEARLIDKNPQWFYAFGSQTSRNVDGRLDGAKVWSNDALGDSFRLHLFRNQ